MLRRSSTVVGLTAASALVTTILATSPALGASSGTGAAAGTSVLSFPFSGSTGTITAPVNVGTVAAVRSSVVTQNSGSAQAVAGLTGAGQAMALPSYSAGSPKNAVVKVANVATSGADPLNPGSGTFSWQADFNQDAQLGTDPRDGDNVVQRGLTSIKTGNTMWKLQADHHIVQCGMQSVLMTGDLLTPGITIPVAPGATQSGWYRATCTRRAGATATLTATVTRWNGATSSWVAFGSQTVGGAAGSVRMKIGVPVSIGGKLDTKGVGLNATPDQFNGDIDNVRLTLG